MRTAWVVTVFGAYFFLMACGSGLDPHSGEDGQRGKASEISFGKLLYDRVSAGEGDHSDWKVFELGQAANVTVKIWWDNPDVKADLFIRGRSTRLSREINHVRGSRHDTMGPIQLPEGKWYVRIRARSAVPACHMSASPRLDI
jgi:hypothetical protein